MMKKKVSIVIVIVVILISFLHLALIISLFVAKEAIEVVNF